MSNIELLADEYAIAEARGDDSAPARKELFDAVEELRLIAKEQHEALVEYRNDRCILERTVYDLIEKYKAFNDR